MFGVGLHFSLADLLSVRAIAIPGAMGQMALVTLLGLGACPMRSAGRSAPGIIFGLALSVASTVVVLRTLQERHQLESERGRIAVGWLVVQDLAMVLALVLLPAFSGVLGGECGDSEPPAAGPLGFFQPDTSSGSARPDAGEARGIFCAHDPGRPTRHSVDPALHRAYRLARAVPPGGSRDRARRRVRMRRSSSASRSPSAPSSPA